MNRNVENIRDSKSVELMIRYKELKDSGVDIISLAGGEPDFPTPEPIKNRIIEEIKNNNTHYSVGKGVVSLRKAISKKLEDDNGIVVCENNILVTPGAKMAIYLAVASCVSPGEDVLIPTPCWVSYTEIVRSVGGNPIEVKLNPDNKYLLTKSILEKAITKKTKMLIICSPNNPTGRVLTSFEIDEIVAFAKDRDIVIISDEIYEKLVFGRNKHISIGSRKEVREKTLTINGFSKAYAMTGWRLGYIAGPSALVETIYKLYAHTITGTPPFIQEAASVAFSCNDYVASMVAEFERRRDFLYKELSSIKGIHAYMPEGTFYLWARFDVQNPSDYLLDEAGVIGVPGGAYGEGFEKYVRFSFSSDLENLKEAAKRIRKSMDKLFY